MSLQRPGVDEDRRVAPRVVRLLLFLVILFVVIWSAELRRTPASSPAEQASWYVESHATDAATIQAVVTGAGGAMAQAVNAPTTAHARYLVRTARAAQGMIDKLQIALARDTTGGALRSPESRLLTAAHDLKSTLVAMVAYTIGGFRSPLAGLTSRYDRARREWNTAVDRIWSVAAEQSVPSIP